MANIFYINVDGTKYDIADVTARYKLVGGATKLSSGYCTINSTPATALSVNTWRTITSNGSGTIKWCCYAGAVMVSLYGNLATGTQVTAPSYYFACNSVAIPYTYAPDRMTYACLCGSGRGDPVWVGITPAGYIWGSNSAQTSCEPYGIITYPLKGYLHNIDGYTY